MLISFSLNLSLTNQQAVPQRSAADAEVAASDLQHCWGYLSFIKTMHHATHCAPDKVDLLRHETLHSLIVICGHPTLLI